MASGRGSTLRFTVEVAADAATQALQAISVAANQAGVQMRTALAGVAPAARQAGEAIGGLGGSVKNFVRDQRGDARAAGFFVTEFLGPLIGQSKLAKEALGALGAGLIGGTGVGFAIEAVGFAAKFLTSGLRESSEAAEKAAEEHRKAAEKMATAYEEASKRLQKTGFAKIAGPGGGTQFEAVQAAAPFQAEVNRLERELADKRAERARLETLWARLKPEEADRARVLHMQAEVPLVEALTAARQKLQTIEEAGSLDVTKATQEDRIKRFERENQILPQVDAHVQAYARHLDELAKKERAAVLAQSQGMTGFEEEGARAPEYQKLKADDFAKGQDAYNKKLRESIALNQQWGEAVGGAIGALITGQATAAQVAAQIGQLIIQSVVRTAIASITAKAAEAGAGAAASQAGIPVVGPALAIGAMGAMMSAVLALLGSLPSARGGWWDTGSYEGLMQIHKGETVLAQPDAEEYRAGVSGRRAPVINIYPTDARDLDRILEDRLPRIWRRLQRGGSL